MMRDYITNKFKSVLFYVAILLPGLIIFITCLLFSNIKEYWFALVFFYLFTLPMEFAAIKYWRVVVTTDENGITIKSSNLLYKAKWTDIIELQELLFGAGELSYILKTKDKKKLTFSSSIENCEELLKEIEYHTGLKFKQRL